MIRTTLTASALLVVGCTTQIVLAEQAEKKPEPIASEVLLQASTQIHEYLSLSQQYSNLTLS